MSTRAPLTPPDADLQDFPFMPLHVSRLRDSDLAAEESPEACWYAVLLWGAAWHQIPAGSLPDNDSVLARLAGLGRDVRTFRKHRKGAMRGWVLCADGRLYHPVVAETVNSAWAEKQAFRDRKARRKVIAENAAAARWGNASSDDDALHDASDSDASSIPSAMLKGRGTGKGRGIESDDVDERARENRNDDPGLAPDASLDQRLALVAERAGISIDPTRPRWPEEAKRLQAWLDKGYALEADVLPAVNRTLEKLGEGVTISSLALIERDLFAARAKARVRAVPKTAAAAPPDFARADEPDNIGVWRSRVGEVIGAAAMRSWFAGTICSIDGDELVVSAPNEFTASFIEANYRPAMEKNAAIALDVPLVRVVSTPAAVKAARG